MDDMDISTTSHSSATAVEGMLNASPAGSSDHPNASPQASVAPELPGSPTGLVSEGADADRPSPRFFLGRPDGTVTPLIAVDELPDEVEIVDIPRLLHHGELLGMNLAGSAERSITRYEVCVGGENAVALRDLNPAVGENGNGHGGGKVDENGNVVRKNPKITQSVGTTDSSHSPASDRDLLTPATTTLGQDTAAQAAPNLPVVTGPPVIGRPAPVHNFSGYTPLTPGVFGRKIYCSHWLRTGECDYTQLGCAYKHEMPDAQTLAALGFRPQNIPPRWFREAGLHLPDSTEPTEPELEWRARPGANYRHLPTSNYGSASQQLNSQARESRPPPPVARPSLGNPFSGRPNVGYGGSGGKNRFPIMSREFTPRAQSRPYSPQGPQASTGPACQMSPFARPFTPGPNALISLATPSPSLGPVSALPSPRLSDNSGMTMSIFVPQESPRAQHQQPHPNPWFQQLPPSGAAQSFGFSRVQPQPQPSRRAGENPFRGFPAPQPRRYFVDDHGSENGSRDGSNNGIGNEHEDRNGNGNGNGSGVGIGYGDKTNIGNGNAYANYGAPYGGGGYGAGYGGGYGSSSDAMPATYATTIGSHLERRYNGPSSSREQFDALEFDENQP